MMDIRKLRGKGYINVHIDENHQYIKTNNAIINLARTDGYYNKYSRCYVKDNKFHFIGKFGGIKSKEIKEFVKDILGSSDYPERLCDAIIWEKKGKLINCKPTNTFNFSSYNFDYDAYEDFEIYGGILDAGGGINYECKYIPEENRFRLLDEV